MQTVDLEFDVIYAAWKNWFDFHYGLECEELFERFCKYVDPKGECYFNPWGDDDDDEQEITPECAERFRQLIGPHHPTLIKAWYAVNPWQ